MATEATGTRKRRTAEERIAELQAKIDAIKNKSKPDEGLEKAKSYADAFMRKLADSGISYKTGLKAYRELMSVSSEGGDSLAAKIGKVKKGEEPWEKDVTYKDPNSNDTWVGGKRGRKPQFILDAMAAGSDAAKDALKAMATKKKTT